MRTELHYCVVDEGDSVLIDEARVPLIISSQQAKAPEERYATGAKLAAALEKDQHYEVFEKEQTIGGHATSQAQAPKLAHPRRRR